VDGRGALSVEHITRLGRAEALPTIVGRHVLGPVGAVS
jgi:hypothetical protein